MHEDLDVAGEAMHVEQGREGLRLWSRCVKVVSLSVLRRGADQARVPPCPAGGGGGGRVCVRARKQKNSLEASKLVHVIIKKKKGKRRRRSERTSFEPSSQRSFKAKEEEEEKNRLAWRTHIGMHARKVSA